MIKGKFNIFIFALILDGILVITNLRAEPTPSSATGLTPPSNLSLPSQPFTVELLTQLRGQWNFVHVLGLRLEAKNPAEAYCFLKPTDNDLRLAYVSCDPEFPDDMSHAVIKFATKNPQSGGDDEFIITEPFFSASFTVSKVRDGVMRCEIRSIKLGSPMENDRYVSGILLVSGEQSAPVWLAPRNSTGKFLVKVTSAHVAHIFSEGEPVALAIEAFGNSQEEKVQIKIEEYGTKRVVWTNSLKILPSTTVRLKVLERQLVRII
jgi:hypothetical protein